MPSKHSFRDDHLGDHRFGSRREEFGITGGMEYDDDHELDQFHLAKRQIERSKADYNG